MARTSWISMWLSWPSRPTRFIGFCSDSLLKQQCECIRVALLARIILIPS